jgi:predicted dienelactone hydrolase
MRKIVFSVALALAWMAAGCEAALDTPGKTDPDAVADEAAADIPVTEEFVADEGVADEAAAGDEAPGDEAADPGPEGFEWEVNPGAGCTDAGCAASPMHAPDPMSWGPYPVGIKTVFIVDETRIKDGKPRTLVTEIWYPAADAALSMPKFKYDPKADAPQVVKDKIGEYEIGAYEVDAYHDAPVRHGEGRFPLILFSHGAFGIRYQSVSYTIPLASHGYVVISPDHEYNTLYDLLLLGWDPSGLGDSALDRPLDLQLLWKMAEEWDADPANDLYKTIQADNVGITGHSFGGYTCFAAANLNIGGEPGPDPRVKVVVPQAPAGYLIPVVGIDPPNWHVPTLMEGGELDDTLGFDQAFMVPWLELGTPKWFLDIKRGGHFTFSDICRLNLLDVAEKLGFDDAAQALSDGCGPINWDWQEAAKAINLYSIAAFNAFLRGSEESKKFLTAEAGAQFGNEIEWFSATTLEQRAALIADPPTLANRPEAEDVVEPSPEVIEPSPEVIDDAEGYCPEC